MSSTSTGSLQPERSLNRQVVLEEEEYTEALSRIIARDFFPSLVHLDATNEYLDALQTRDPHLITASVRRLEQLVATPTTSRQRIPSQTPGRTPFGYTAETPLTCRSESGEPQRKRPRYDTNMSLDEFQAQYTSEDNSSFLHILDEENRMKKEKYGWAWEAQKKVETQRDKMIEQREKMLIEAPTVTGVRGKFTIEAPKPAGLLTEGSEGGHERRMNNETGEESQAAVTLKTVGPSEQPVDVMAPVKDTRPAGVDGWKFKTRNSLMFTPDADISPYDPPSATADRAEQLKKVEYASTRLSEQEHNVDDKILSAPPSPTRSHVNAAITGQSRTFTDSGFSLVPDLPSPTPAELGSSAMKQLMTWGTLNATPRIIGHTGDPIEPSTPFHIPKITSREAIAHKLSNKAAKSLRVKAEMFTPRPGKTPVSGSMAPPSWTPRRPDAMVGSLTPAARRLLERTTSGTALSKKLSSLEGSSRRDARGKG